MEIAAIAIIVIFAAIGAIQVGSFLFALTIKPRQRPGKAPMMHTEYRK
jgi:hypothetical protein